MELISREDVIKALQKWNCRDSESLTINPYEVLRDIPTIEERKEGKWMRLKDNQVCCSMCGYLTTWIEDTDIHGMAIALLGEKYAKYCPNCGARMKGE